MSTRHIPLSPGQWTDIADVADPDLVAGVGYACSFEGDTKLYVMETATSSPPGAGDVGHRMVAEFQDIAIPTVGKIWVRAQDKAVTLVVTNSEEE